MQAVLGLLGLEDKDVANSDTLEGLGVDSMQLAEIRTRLQRALCRPVPIEEVRACSGPAGNEPCSACPAGPCSHEEVHACFGCPLAQAVSGMGWAAFPAPLLNATAL